MDKAFKEEAKSLLGFQQVPFYVVLDENGEIVQKGGSKQVDFDTIPGMNPQINCELTLKEYTKEQENIISADVKTTSYTSERIFCLDDDF